MLQQPKNLCANHRATSHTRLKARDHCILIKDSRWLKRAETVLVHFIVDGSEGLRTQRKLSWMKSLHGFLHVELWIVFHGLWEIVLGPLPRGRFMMQISPCLFGCMTFE